MASSTLRNCRFGHISGFVRTKPAIATIVIGRAPQNLKTLRSTPRGAPPALRLPCWAVCSRGYLKFSVQEKYFSRSTRIDKSLRLISLLDGKNVALDESLGRRSRRHGSDVGTDSLEISQQVSAGLSWRWDSMLYTTLEECIRRIHIEGKIASTVLFGSSVRNKEELDEILSLTQTSGRTLRLRPGSELDLLLVTEEKSLSLIDLLRHHLAQYGDLVFHPNSYDTRDVSRLTFEIIALPLGSSWFAQDNLGRLVGLSILEPPNFVQFAGKPIGDSIEMPRDAKTSEERILVALHSHVGLIDMYSKLWAAIGNGDRVDPFRVAKWLMCDSVWTQSGIFYLDRKVLVEKFMDAFSELADKHRALLRTIETRREGLNDVDVLREDYELARGLIQTLQRSLPEGRGVGSVKNRDNHSCSSEDRRVGIS